LVGFFLFGHPLHPPLGWTLFVFGALSTGHEKKRTDRNHVSSYRLAGSV
jgi:hypothetical protein